MVDAPTWNLPPPASNMDAIEEETSDLELNEELNEGQSSSDDPNEGDLYVDTTKDNVQDDSDKEDQTTRDTTAEDIIKDEIRSRMQQYVHTYNAGDAERLASFYVTDSFFVAPNRPFVRGPEGVLKCGIIKNLMDMGAKRLQIKEGDMTVSSHLASVIAEFMLFDEDDDEFDDGRLVHVWVKIGDDWFLKYDMFN